MLRCSNIVALAGAEQIQTALNTGADVVIAGRTTDTAIIAALPLQTAIMQGLRGTGPRSANVVRFVPQTHNRA